MEDQLLQTTFDPRIPELLSVIKSITASNRRGRRGIESLQKELEELLRTDEDDIRGIRQRIQDDLMLYDYILEDLGTSIARRLIVGKARGKTLWDRAYNIVTKCPKCAKSRKKKDKDNSKNRQIVPFSSYVREAHVLDGSVLDDLVAAGYNPTCSTYRCGTPLEITNAANIIIPTKKQTVHLLAQRIKSAGRYCQKLVDVIFYDKNDPRMKKRSLLDKYAFSLVLNLPDGAGEKEYRRMFRNAYGESLPPNSKYGDFDTTLCYEVFHLLNRWFEIDAGQLQDNFREPKIRERNGKVEEYRMLQFPLRYQGRIFEGQIKSADTFYREQDRKSAIGHDNYVEVEDKLRQEMFKRIPEARVVYNLLMQIFAKEECAVRPR